MVFARLLRVLCMAAIFAGIVFRPPACVSAPFFAGPPDSTGPGAGRGKIAPPRDYRQARRMMREIYAGLEMSFYCGCRYQAGESPDSASCGYKPARNDPRARRLEWEHVVPASWLGRGRECWRRPAACRRKNGKDRPRRACCRRIDPEFRFMEGDPHNLVPAIGELNARRSDYPFGIVPGEARRFGACDFEIATGRGRGPVEPRPEIRGDIARIHFYMMDRYGIPLETDYLAMLQEWGRQDPVSPLERLRDERIRERTGVSNPFVTGELE